MQFYILGVNYDTPVTDLSHGFAHKYIKRLIWKKTVRSVYDTCHIFAQYTFSEKKLALNPFKELQTEATF